MSCGGSFEQERDSHWKATVVPAPAVHPVASQPLDSPEATVSFQVTGQLQPRGAACRGLAWEQAEGGSSFLPPAVACAIAVPGLSLPWGTWASPSMS